MKITQLSVLALISFNFGTTTVPFSATGAINPVCEIRYKSSNEVEALMNYDGHLELSVVSDEEKRWSIKNDHGETYQLNSNQPKIVSAKSSNVFKIKPTDKALLVVKCVY